MFLVLPEPQIGMKFAPERPASARRRAAPPTPAARNQDPERGAADPLLLSPSRFSGVFLFPLWSVGVVSVLMLQERVFRGFSGLRSFRPLENRPSRTVLARPPVYLWTPAEPARARARALRVRRT